MTCTLNRDYADCVKARGAVTTSMRSVLTDKNGVSEVRITGIRPGAGTDTCVWSRVADHSGSVELKQRPKVIEKPAG